MAQRVESSTEVEAPVERVYGYWQNLENLPSFMKNIEDVSYTSPDTTHWQVKGPLGKTFEFDARTTRNEPNEAIAWNSTDGDLGTSGEVRFREVGPSRTRIEVQMNYANPPGGALGEAASRLTSGPKAILEQDLKNFKDILEGRATPEDVQNRPSAAPIHTGAVVAFLTSGAGLAGIGGVLLLYLLLRRGGGNRNRRRAARGRRANDRIRFTIEM